MRFAKDDYDSIFLSLIACIKGHPHDSVDDLASYLRKIGSVFQKRANQLMIKPWYTIGNHSIHI